VVEESMDKVEAIQKIRRLQNAEIYLFHREGCKENKKKKSYQCSLSSSGSHLL